MNDHDAVSLLEGLVTIPSVSRNERRAADHLVGALANRGARAFIDDAGNAVGVFGEGDGTQDLVLLGHIDTVPGEIPVRIEHGELWGRGAVDAKGPLSAFAAAASRVRVPEGSRLIVIGAVEEEVATSKGARHVAEQYAPRACIIGEPSAWDSVTIGYKGRLLAEVRVEAPCAHPAGPTPSAGEIAADLWIATRAFADEFNKDRTGAFTQLQAALRDIRTSSDGLTQTATMTLGFRLPPNLTPESVESVILARAAVLDAAVEFRGREIAHVEPRTSPVARALVNAIRTAGGSPSLKVKTGTADMNVVAPVWRCPIVAYGPGDSSLDHTPVERLSIDEYLRSISILENAIHRLFEQMPDLAEPERAG
ncbi:MAG: [LysW]-lysine hydrolase [Phycisphaerales bacterium]